MVVAVVEIMKNHEVDASLQIPRPCSDVRPDTHKYLASFYFSGSVSRTKHLELHYKHHFIYTTTLWIFSKSLR